jgi:hypothetical protein
MDDYGSVSIETSANNVAKIFIWALIIKMFMSIFWWLWNGASGVGKTLYKWLVGILGSALLPAV